MKELVRRVLFLDIDGVLNSTAYFHFRTDAAKAERLHARFKPGLGEPRSKEEHALAMIDPAAVEHLNAILDVTSAKVVISSSWRMAYTLGEISRALGANGFRHHRAIIGSTPVLNGPRGLEIDVWLNEHAGALAQFVILDDSDDMEPHGSSLVQTNFTLGLRQEHVARAITLLSESGG